MCNTRKGARAEGGSGANIQDTLEAGMPMDVHSHVSEDKAQGEHAEEVDVNEHNEDEEGAQKEHNKLSDGMCTRIRTWLLIRPPLGTRHQWIKTRRR